MDEATHAKYEMVCETTAQKGTTKSDSIEKIIERRVKERNQIYRNNRKAFPERLHSFRTEPACAFVCVPLKRDRKHEMIVRRIMEKREIDVSCMIKDWPHNSSVMLGRREDML